jgi:hypothetical protein
MTGLPDYMKIKELYLSGMSTTSKQSKVQMNLKQLRYLWKHLNQSVQNPDKQSTVNIRQTDKSNVHNEQTQVSCSQSLQNKQMLANNNK